MIPAGVLTALGARLAATARGDGELDAVVDGVPVEVRFVLRTQGSSSSKWTEVGAQSTSLKGFAFAFNFDVRETQDYDAAHVRAGRLRDLVLGDAAFDEAFVVEAAPEEVARLMFDETTRAEMLALRPLRVISTSKYAVMIERLDWSEDVDLLERLVRLVVRIAASLTPSAREAALARRRTAQTRGYRDHAPTDEEIRAEWDADLAAMNVQAERRAIRSRRIALTFAFSTLAIIAAAALVLATRC